ncbi:carbon storage regulator [uncultured Paludibaculum sp.]|uniref:carbon storage regulator n=1 Tax=uncultured Paludibaculum sp. TaxID=1765020 RepID=UPI002AAB3B35|nr:carbon storage regulator [uncultured Paludibaculum sp.]
MQRRQGDTILIGDEIEIQILESTRSHVKLGLIVPKKLPIVRGEIRKVSEQNRSAAQGAGVEPPALLALRLRSEMGLVCAGERVAPPRPK